jgi:hypothetical protein
MRYHISPTTGNPNQCRAKSGGCPFGSDREHYFTKEEARSAYEASQQVFAEASAKDKPLEMRLGKDGWLSEEFAVQTAPRGVSCPSCGKATSHQEAASLVSNEWVYCSCGKRYDIGEAKVEITPDNPSYGVYQNKEAVKDQIWYHASSQEDWLTTVENRDDPHGPPESTPASFQAHVGTEAAAFDRALTEQASRWNRTPEAFYLYEVRVTPNAQVADEVAADENSKLVGDSTTDVTRYINRWEDMASVSLAVTSSKLEIVGRRKVEPVEAHQRISVYNINPQPEEEEEKELLPSHDEVLRRIRELEKQRDAPLTAAEERMFAEVDERLARLVDS